ncbi:MAG: hypothetical protein U5R30_13870 [Deltaproteobacteria bacterium]|nr:hypothetical protein [Deltaproteobacteria bacterium]
MDPDFPTSPYDRSWIHDHEANLAFVRMPVMSWMMKPSRTPLLIVPARDGIDREALQRHRAISWLVRYCWTGDGSGNRQPSVQIDRIEGIPVAQLGAVDHPWNCQPGDPDLPGRLIDLDPAPDVPFGRVIEAASNCASGWRASD